MDYETFTAQTVAEAVGLTNLFATPEVAEADLAELLHLYAPSRPVDVTAFGSLAHRLRAVFAADDADARVARLNDLIETYEPRPIIAEHDGQAPHFHFAPDDGDDVRRVGASLVMALAHVVVDEGADRLGRCGAPGCDRVFVDHSRGGNRRFCSKTCATRVHVAAHRARTST